MIPIESKTERLIAILLEEIASGRYPANACLPSERELAGRHAVSRITIRRALAALEARGSLTRRQGKGTLVGKAIGFESHPVQPATKRVGFLYMPGRQTSALFERVFHGFREFSDATVASRVYFQGYLTAEVCRQDRLDVLVVDGAFDDAAIADLNRAGFKTIVLNRVTAAGPYICTNNEMGGDLMIAHLASRGHRAVGVYPGSPHPGAHPGDEMALRIRGMEKAARKHGVELLFLRPSSYEALGINEAIRDLIRRGCPCTAVAALTDIYAQLVYNELKHGGVAIPDRVSLIGYDDQSFDPFLPVPLTSIRQPVAEIARVLARVVNEFLRGTPLHLRRQIAPVLIERDSVRDLRPSSRR